LRGGKKARGESKERQEKEREERREKREGGQDEGALV
jgi:hypothetical protein